MHELPADWNALCALAFLFGARHGLDADHLAAIDGLTRIGARQRQAWARFGGTLFSLGHGAVVMAVAALAATLPARWSAPAWLQTSGALVSIAVLLGLAALNVNAAWRAPAGRMVAPVGLRGGFVRRLLAPAARRGGALQVLGVGALFALSFDTLSLAALFGAAALPVGHAAHALLPAALFVLGMLLSDGLNGWWIAHLLARADRLAAVASRTMTLALAALSLLVAGLGAARLGSAWVDRQLEGRDLALGVALVVMVALAYALARRAGLAASRHEAAVATAT